jgi:hypothetical protein
MVRAVYSIFLLDVSELIPSLGSFRMTAFRTCGITVFVFATLTFNRHHLSLNCGISFRASWTCS